MQMAPALSIPVLGRVRKVFFLLLLLFLNQLALYNITCSQIDPGKESKFLALSVSHFSINIKWEPCLKHGEYRTVFHPLKIEYCFCFAWVCVGLCMEDSQIGGRLIQNQVGLSDCESMWFGLRQKEQDDIFSKVRVSPEVTELKNSLKD